MGPFTTGQNGLLCFCQITEGRDRLPQHDLDCGSQKLKWPQLCCSRLSFFWMRAAATNDTAKPDRLTLKWIGKAALSPQHRILSERSLSRHRLVRQFRVTETSPSSQRSAASKEIWWAACKKAQIYLQLKDRSREHQPLTTLWVFPHDRANFARCCRRWHPVSLNGQHSGFTHPRKTIQLRWDPVYQIDEACTGT